MKVTGKSKTPITAAQSKGRKRKSADGKPGGTKARASQQTSKKKNNGVKTAVLERVSDGILAFDAGMNYTYLNERAGELLGLQAEDWIGKNLREGFSGVERTPFMEACQHALETQSVVWLNEYFPPTGRWLEGRVYPSQDGVSVLFTEGAVRKTGEGENRYRIVVESMQEAFFLADVLTDEQGQPWDYRYVDVNTVMEQLLVKPRAEIIGRTIREIIPSLTPRDLELVKRIAAVGLGSESFFVDQYSESMQRWFRSHFFSPQPGQVSGMSFDVSASKQAGEALHAIVSQASAGITHTDLEGRFTYVNQAFCDMLGYSEAELTQMSIWDVTDSDFLDRNRRMFGHLSANGEGYQMEKRLVCKNGACIWVNVGTSPLQDTDGRIQGATSVVVDITRRKRAEQSLLEGARRSLFLSSLSDTIRSIDVPSKIQVEASCLLGAHLKASRVAYVEVSPDGRFLVSGQYMDDVQEMSGWFPLTDFLPQDQGARFQTSRVVTTSDVQNDSRFSTAQKEMHEALSIQAQMILPFKHGGQVVAALLVQQARPRAWQEEEISLVEESMERMQAAIERARAEDRLRESEKRFRILANAVPSIVWTSTSDGQLLYVNDRWYDFTGLPRQETAPSWADLKLHPEDVQSFFQKVGAIKSAAAEAVVEVRLQRQDGTYRWFQTRSVPTLDEKGNITAWHGVLTDIHDRVEKDAEQRKVIDTTPFMLTRCNRDLHYVFVSRAYAEMIGMTPEEVVGRPIVEILGEEGLETIRPFVERVLQGERVEYESQVPYKTGATPYLHATYTPDYDEQGNVIGWFASIVDITDRRKMEETLRESEHKFNITFNKLPFTAVLLRPEDNVVMDINEEFETVFGYAKHEAVGKTTFELGILSNPEDRAEILTKLQSTVSIRDLEIELYTRPRGPRLFVINTDLVEISGNSYILQTAQDITERRQAEKDLAKERELLEKIFKSIPVMLTIYEPVTGRQQLNAYFERLTGWKNKAGLTPRTLAENCYPDPEYRQEVIRKMMACREGDWIDVRMRTQDGRVIETAWSKITFSDGMQVGLGIDITERKQSEAALRASEERMRLAIESNRMVTWEWDPQSDRVTTSNNFPEVYGLSSIDTASEGFSLIWPQDLPAHREKVDQIMRSGGEYRSEFRITRPEDGLALWVEERAIALLGGDGKVTRLVGIAMDISERKRVEEELRQSKQRLSLTYHHAPIGITESTLDGRFLEVNDEFCKMLGYTYAELLNLSISQVTYQNDLEMEMELYRQLVAGAIPFYRIEKRFIHRDGSLLWAEVVRTMVFDEASQPLYAIGGVLNIHERKQKEEELRARNEEIETLMEVSPIGIFIAHDPECTTITANPAGYRLVEMPENSNENVSKSAPEAERPSYRTFRSGVELKVEELPMQAAARLGMEIEEETLELRFDNGAQKYIYAYAKPLFDTGGKVRGAVASMLDITQRMQKEEELRARTEEIETLMQVSPIGILVAHDPQCNKITGNPAANDLLRLPGGADPNLSNPALAERGMPHWLYRDGVELAVPDLPMQTAARLGIEVKDEALELRFGDGSQKYIYLYARPLFDTQNKTRGAIAAMLDVSESRRNEKALRESEERFSKAFRVSPDAVTISRTEDGHILDINNSWSALFGYEPQEAIGKSSLELNLFPDPQDRARVVDLLKEQGYVRDYEVDIRRKSGEIRHAILAVENIEINGVDCLISILRDITERKLAEQSLRQSEERFAQFMQHFPGHAWIKDLQGRYVYANAAVFKTYNLSPAELYGRTDQEAFPHEMAVQFSSTDEVALEDGKGMQFVQQSRLDDQTTSHSLITKFPIPGPEGRPALIGGTALDITERIQMEDALRVARAQAEQSAHRMTQLQKITAALSQALTPAQIAKMVVEQGIPVLGAASGSVILLNEEDQFLEIMYSSASASAVRPFSRFPLSMPTPAADAIHSGSIIWIKSKEEYLERYPNLADMINKWDNQVAVAVPMNYKGHSLGALALSFGKTIDFSTDDQEYLLTLARQAAQALERARVENALRLDATMMENVSAGVYLVRASDGTIVHTNPRFDSLFGYEPGEINGRHVSIINAPTARSAQEGSGDIIDALRREGSWQGEVLSIRKDGTPFWSFASITTYEHPSYGTVWVAARQDISGQKQVAEALRESEQRYRAIVNQATAGIVRKDRTGRLLVVNQAFCDMLGMTEAELIGRRIWEMTHEEDAPENKRLYDRLMAEGTPFQLEKRLIRKDNSILWTSVSVSPVIDDSGRTNSAVSVYVDVTRRRQAESRLAMLAIVSELTRQYDEPEELFYAVSRVIGEHFHVRRSLFNEIDLEHDREIVHRDYCRGVGSMAGVYTISRYGSLLTAEMMAGRTIVSHDSKLDPRTATDYERAYVQYGERAYVTIPLLREERWVASLRLSDDQPREWDRDDVSLLETIAERTWTAAEKLRIDRALRDSEERLRVTFNTTVVGFATLTPDSRFLDVNDALCQLVGYSRAELLAMSYEGLVHPRFNDNTREEIRQLLEAEISSSTIEKIFIRRDGTEIWVQNSISLVWDANGDPLHLIIICQDVTERKRAEEALYQLNLELEERVRRRTIELQAANEFLRESEATSRLILESMPDAIVIIDRHGEIVHANTHVQTLFGYSPQEVMGQPVETLVPEKLRDKHTQLRPSYGDQPTRRIMGLGHDLFGRRKDATEFPVEVMLAPIDNSTNWDILVAIRDNTKQRDAQQALRANEEKLRTLFEILPVGISFLNKEGRISELNNALTEILGLSRAELLSGKHGKRLYIRADGTPMPDSEFASTRARAEKKTIYNVETGIVKENGEVTWTSVNAAPVQIADVEAAIVTIDITERKQAEEVLHKQRERLKKLSRRLVEVQEEERHAIAQELHDRVGQNLAALTLNLNILRNQLSAEVLDKVGTRLNDSVTLVKDILTITRSVMADLRPDVLDDYGLDAALTEFAERFMQRYGIRVITHTPAKPTPRLERGIEMTLLRITQEALKNVARHSQASQAVISVEMDSEAILMTIEDNGLGILSWQKVNQPGNHGLRIMRERAEAFGGYLKVHSTYKNGTKIEVKIPLGSSGSNVSKERN